MQVQGSAVLIKPEDNPEKIGSIIIPKTVKEKPNLGTVIQAGPACKEISVGDKVHYQRKAASVIWIDEEEHHFVQEFQILYKVL